MPAHPLIRPFLPEEADTVPPLREDALVAAVVGVVCAVTTLVRAPDGVALDARGWLLLAATVVPLVWRRRAPFRVLLVHLAADIFYHGLDYDHIAPFAATALAVYSVAVAGPRWRTVVLSHVLVFAVVAVFLMTREETSLETLRVTGWVLACVILGEVMRLHGQYVLAIRERAERAERTREEEAARRVAEERLRIARDLHDLIAHSITVIGVRVSVASHLITHDPGRLDPGAVAAALDGIADTCREARAELRTTLRVLRGGASGDEEPDDSAPPPDLDGIADLARTAEEAGARVGLTVAAGGGVPPVVGAAAYRIVQEALTNAVRHAGPGVAVDVGVVRDGDALRIAVTDDGGRAAVPAARTAPGYGITGMRERARSIGGTFTAAPAPAGGFRVEARLPLPPGGEDGERAAHGDRRNGEKA
ncbi:sensor histidine kinase [Streptomyces sp. RFCAC02]|uniref:sensor histidine kinase n=1 Tax=Streptomyces sp. RFCAC02 TaxID=2499143 RepID=UPI0010216635|nr:sensor histidine kinase [Streptomyces sp. RFCAC02]